MVEVAHEMYECIIQQGLEISQQNNTEDPRLRSISELKGVSYRMTHNINITKELSRNSTASLHSRMGQRSIFPDSH